jgi:hypothetical protein
MGRNIPSMLAAVLLTATLASGETAREILDQAKVVNDAREPKDKSQKTKMTLVDSRGGERVRDLEIYSKSHGHGTRRALTFFLSPPEVKGVGLLSWSYPDRDDDQWLYLPELKRVRQISGSSRRQSFQGSDFSYDDIEIIDDIRDWTEQDATSKLVRDGELLEGVQCAVIELVLRDKPYDYSRLLLWLDRVDSTFRKIEFYDKRDGALVKTLTLGRFATIDGVPTAQHVEMVNAKKGTKTVLDLSETRYNRGFTDEVFSQRTLERGRVD